MTLPLPESFDFAPFVSLSYPTSRPLHPDSFPDSNYYLTGPLDACFIVTCIAVMAVLRDASRLLLMEPFAQWYLTRQLKLKKRGEKTQANGAVANGATNGHANGHHPKTQTVGEEKMQITKKEARAMRHSVLRFAEQGWSVIYYTSQWSFGLYVHRQLPTKMLNPSDVWLGYPHIELAGTLKFYYLTQTAFYLHQILIINAEARRKDHWQMMAHHVITIALMGTSYFLNWTRIGCLITLLMDMCDIFLPLAKMFKYLQFEKLCDATFVAFMLSWLVTRHGLFIIAIYSTCFDLPRIVPFEWAPERGHYFTENTWRMFAALLCSLQVIQIAWFWMIGNIAWRVISGQNAEDDRSEDEGGDLSKED